MTTGPISEKAQTAGLGSVSGRRILSRRFRPAQHRFYVSEFLVANVTSPKHFLEFLLVVGRRFPVVLGEIAHPYHEPVACNTQSKKNQQRRYRQFGPHHSYNPTFSRQTQTNPAACHLILGEGDIESPELEPSRFEKANGRRVFWGRGKLEVDKKTDGSQGAVGRKNRRIGMLLQRQSGSRLTCRLRK